MIKLLGNCNYPVSPVHLLNALLPSVIKLLGNFNISNPLHLSNTNEPIEVIESGKFNAPVNLQF